MRDFRERRAKLAADLEECEMIALLATDATKRDTFRRLSGHLKQMIADIDEAIAVLSKSASPENP